MLLNQMVLHLQHVLLKNQRIHIFHQNYNNDKDYLKVYIDYTLTDQNHHNYHNLHVEDILDY